MISEPDRTPGDTPVPKRSRNPEAEEYHQSLADTQPTRFGTCSHLLANCLCDIADGRSDQSWKLHLTTWCPGLCLQALVRAPTWSSPGAAVRPLGVAFWRARCLPGQAVR